MVLVLRLTTLASCIALAATSFAQTDALSFDNLNATATDYAVQAAPRAGGKFEWKLNTEPRTFKNVDKDPADPLASARGGGTLTVSKDGILTMAGKGPRYYVTAPSPVFLNVEMISYGRLTKKKESGFKDLAGMTMVTRSNHALFDKKPCMAMGYYSRIYFNTGEFAFQKEFYHSKEKDVTVYSKSRRKKLFDGGFPLNKWIGMKYELRTSDDGKSVHLRGFVDENESGEWKLVFETTDDGGWEANKEVPSECGVQKDEIVLRPGSNSYFRTDDVEEFQWKKMEIRVL